MTLLVSKPYLQDVLVFARRFIVSGDIDPVYPVLRHLIASLRLEELEGLWLTVLYGAYYNLASGLAAYRILPKPCKPRGQEVAALITLPCAAERRGLRGGRIILHLNSWLEVLSETGATLKEYLANKTCEDVWAAIEAIWGNGRWAAFKFGELLQQVQGWPVFAPTAMIDQSTGPKLGLTQVGEGHWQGEAGLASFRMYLEGSLGLAITLEQAETVLCDFHSLAAGAYYIGHDIDKMQEQIDTSQLCNADKELLFLARKATLDNNYLGEVHGWNGISGPLKQFYKKTGMVSHGTF